MLSSRIPEAKFKVFASLYRGSGREGWTRTNIASESSAEAYSTTPGICLSRAGSGGGRPALRRVMSSARHLRANHYRTRNCTRNRTARPEGANATCGLQVPRVISLYGGVESGPALSRFGQEAEALLTLRSSRDAFSTLRFWETV